MNDPSGEAVACLQVRTSSNHQTVGVQVANGAAKEILDIKTGQFRNFSTHKMHSRPDNTKFVLMIEPVQVNLKFD